MSAKHTPGPWDAWLGKSRFGMTGPAAAASCEAVFAMRKGFGKELFVEMSSPSKTTPAIALGNTMAEAQANARLIASAPDLLAQLQAAANYIDVLGGDSNSYRGAITKATGDAK